MGKFVESGRGSFKANEERCEECLTKERGASLFFGGFFALRVVYRWADVEASEFPRRYLKKEIVSGYAMKQSRRLFCFCGYLGPDSGGGEWWLWEISVVFSEVNVLVAEYANF